MVLGSGFPDSPGTEGSAGGNWRSGDESPPKNGLGDMLNGRNLDEPQVQEAFAFVGLSRQG